MSITVDLIEGAGGLFDFNATLPLIAVQFVLLTVLLTFVFYKPVYNVLNTRETAIATNLGWVSETLSEVETNDNKFKNDLEICSATVKANIIKAKQEANSCVGAEVKRVRDLSIRRIDKATNTPVDTTAIDAVNNDTNNLSEFIKNKLLS